MASKHDNKILLSMLILLSKYYRKCVCKISYNGQMCLLYYLQINVKQFCVQFLQVSILSTGLPFENSTCSAKSSVFIYRKQALTSTRFYVRHSLAEPTRGRLNEINEHVAVVCFLVTMKMCMYCIIVSVNIWQLYIFHMHIFEFKVMQRHIWIPNNYSGMDPEPLHRFTMLYKVYIPRKMRCVWLVFNGGRLLHVYRQPVIGVLVFVRFNRLLLHSELIASFS